MAVFPYPVRSFVCRTYDAPVWEKMLRLDEAFYHPLCMYAGGVAGETGIPGLKLDFRAGLRLEVPKGAFHVFPMARRATRSSTMMCRRRCSSPWRNIIVRGASPSGRTGRWCSRMISTLRGRPSTSRS